jgi:hypothetical protein
MPEIWIPGQAEERPAPFVCRICQERFWESRGYERHVVKCYNRNEAEVREQSIKERAPTLYGDEAGDPELESWVRKHKTEILEDRKKM